MNDTANQSSANTPRATIAFVPREVFCTTKRALEAIYERTNTPNNGEPFELICVDGNSPPEVAEYLRQQSQEKGFKLLRTEQYLAPNQARNLVLEHVQTPYVVFVDNDAQVAEGWLKPLVDCAEQTGAWAVGPLTFEYAPECQIIHLFGGDCKIETLPDGSRTYLERHHLGHVPLAEVEETLERREVEIIEFHTALVAMKAFDALGPLDEGLLSMFEYGDLCLAIRERGERVFVEPESRVTYVPPKRLEEADREFFKLRWSEAWTQATIDRMTEKWNLSPSDPEMVRAIKWVGEHRRLDSQLLRRMRHLLGKKWARSFEKRVAPVEALANRKRFPMGQANRLSQPQVEVMEGARVA